jgi:hypothetical protein
VDAGGGQRLFLALDALHFDQPSSAHSGEQRPRKYDTLTNLFPEQQDFTLALKKLLSGAPACTWRCAGEARFSVFLALGKTSRPPALRRAHPSLMQPCGLGESLHWGGFPPMVSLNRCASHFNVLRGDRVDVLPG